MTDLDWRKDLPPGTEEVWDITAKALLLRLGGSVVIDEAEAMRAANTPCECSLDENGAFHFRVETN